MSNCLTLAQLVAESETLRQERDSFRDEVERRDVEYLQLRARYDEAKAEVARLSKMLHTAQDAACKSIGELSELRTRHNNLAAENGRLEARLEAVREWTPKMADRRAYLVEEQYRHGPLTSGAEMELGALQDLFGRYQAAIAPLPYGERT